MSPLSQLQGVILNMGEESLSVKGNGRLIHAGNYQIEENSALND